MRPSTRQKRQKIIEVAAELFLNQGMAHTCLDQIIERCGGSKQTLYRYFGDKKGLFIAVINRSIEQVSKAFKINLDSTEPLQQQLQQLGCTYLTTILSPHPLCTYRTLLMESQCEPQLVDYYIKMGPSVVLPQLEKFLVSQMDKGILRRGEPAQVARQLVVLFKGDLQQMALMTGYIPDQQEIERHVQQAVDCFLHGYAA
ncbi:MAG: TetR/AcrR family transcriptional regulator [Enterobacteriaceae bacterium]